MSCLVSGPLCKLRIGEFTVIVFGIYVVMIAAAAVIAVTDKLVAGRETSSHTMAQWESDYKWALGLRTIETPNIYTHQTKSEKRKGTVCSRGRNRWFLLNKVSTFIHINTEDR